MRLLPAKGGEAFFVSGKVLLGPDELGRSFRRLAHEILESNRGAAGLVLVGLRTRGVPVAERLAAAIRDIEGVDVPVGSLDIALYRDDLGRSAVAPEVRPSDIPTDIEDRTIVLVDDVLFTGRSIRAAMDALNDFGRPARIRLAVVVDRGHRELPIRPDFVGKNVPTAREEQVRVRLEETDGEDAVVLVQEGEA